jgi:PAS domain S-box-containing protein
VLLGYDAAGRDAGWGPAERRLIPLGVLGVSMTVARRGGNLPPVQLTSLRFFGHVFTSAGLAALVTDLQGRIQHANPAAEKLLGWGPGELRDHSVEELVAPGQAPVLVDQALAAGGVWSGRMLERRKSGAVIPVRLTVSVIRDGAGDPIALLSLMSDHTQHERQQARLRSLVGLSVALNAESDLNVLLGTICEEARAFFAVDGVYLSRFDDETRELVGLAAAGPGSAGFDQTRFPLPDATQSGAARALVERRPIVSHYGDASDAHYPELARAYQLRSVLSVPLLSGERLLGLLVMNDARQAERFTPRDLTLARDFAELAAVALENARLHQAERRMSERLRELAHVGQLLTLSLERDKVFEAISAGARRLLGIDEARIWLLETPDGPLRLAHAMMASRRAPVPEMVYANTLLATVYRTGEVWQTANILAEPRWTDRDYVMEHGLDTCMVIPLEIQGRLLGGITFLARGSRVFNDGDVELARAFGHQAAIAVQNAETLARERHASRLERLLETAQSLRPEDRQRVRNLLDAAERLVEMGTPVN